jgi:hypothetical protein
MNRPGSVARLAIVLSGLVLSLCAPTTAAAARSEFFGIAQGAMLDDQDIRGMAAARIHTDRFMLEWDLLERSQGSINWTAPDDFIGALASKGIRALPFMWGSPSWVAANPAHPPIDTAAHEQAWRDFLKAAVARYGPGGSYWGTPYHQKYGAGATPLPVQSWQIWNEPHLRKYFTNPSPDSYARLLQISHDAIKSIDPQAQIVLAGTLSDFLNGLYSVPGIKGDFDLGAVHPYASNLDQVRMEIESFRTVMNDHADAATPLWITEFAWGSAPPDSFGINRGLLGQEKMLKSSYTLILNHRTAWNVQRLFWFHWRDPFDSTASCSFCNSAGLLRYDRTRKPAFYTFKSFTAETTPPQVSITGGPSNGGSTRDPTPTFWFASNEAGSTFECRVDASSLNSCSWPFTTARLADGPHAFYVRAIDAPGNESPLLGRSFKVDTQAPATPQITGTDPVSPANNNNPKVKGSAEASSTVRIYKTVGCTGAPLASGFRAEFASPGITATVPDNSTTYFRATARDPAGNTSACSAARQYIEVSTAP